METKQNIQNVKFDLRTFLRILKQNLIFIVLILLFAGVVGYLVVRYTQPLFTSTAIIQIKSENKTNSILKLSNEGAFSPSDLDYSIEQIRSKEFIKNVINSLNIRTAYFIQGTILFTELYPNSLFTVEANVKNQNIFDKKIICRFTEKECFLKIDNKEFGIPLGEKVSLEYFDIQVNADINQLKELSKNIYFFILYNENTLIKEITNSLTISKQNQLAGTILLTYAGINANKTATVINTIASNFLNYDIFKKMEKAQNTIDYIDEQISIVGKNLEQTENAIYNFKIANNIANTNENFNSAKNNAIISQTVNIETEIMKIDYEISALKDVSNLVQNSKDIKIYEILALISGLNSSNLLSGLINSIQELYNQREMMLFNVTENSNKIKVIDEIIANRVKTIKEFLNSTIARLTENKKNLLETKEKIESGVIIDKLYNALEYAKLTREYSINQEYYSQLINSKIITFISKSGFSTDNQILEKASDSAIPSYPNTKKNYAMAYAVALILIFFLVAFRYMFFNKILSLSDISNYSTVSILGSIPKFNRKTDISKVVIVDYPKSGLAEAFRNIRTKLNFYNIESECRTICISSTVSGEGKTFVSLNLAASFAMLEKKTIILDFDLRKPRIHKSFETDNKKGISTILIGEHSLEESINHSNIKFLDFLTSGAIPPNPAELLLSKKLTDIINTLKQNYEIIIIDTPPIGIISDAVISFKYADNSIFVFRSNISLKKYINLIEKESVENEIKHLAFVLNDCEKSIHNYNYSSKYYTGYYNDIPDNTKFSLKKLFKKHN